MPQPAAASPGHETPTTASQPAGDHHPQAAAKLPGKRAERAPDRQQSQSTKKDIGEEGTGDATKIVDRAPVPLADQPGSLSLVSSAHEHKNAGGANTDKEDVTQPAAPKRLPLFR